MPTALTEDQIDEFKSRHWLVEWFIPSEGKFIYDDIFNSYVLVFELQNGDVIYAFVEKDYTVSDPSRIEYIVNETIKAIKENTQNLAKNVGSGFKISSTLIISIVALLIILEIRKR